MPDLALQDITHIVWDWNGTLLRDVDICIESANELLQARDLPLLQSVEDYRNLFTFPVIRYYEALGFQFDSESFSDIAQLYVRHYESKLASCTLYPGTLDTLRSLRDAGYSQVLISASEQKSLERQMAGHQVNEFFTDILGMQNLLATGKADLAMRWLHTNRVSPKHVVLIGDTIHDFEVSQTLKCCCILIANGHQSIERLKKTGAIVVPDISCVRKLIL